MALRDYCVDGDGTQANRTVGGDDYFAQTFTASASYTIDTVKLKIYRTATSFDVNVEIQGTTAGKPDNSAIASGTISGADFGTTAAWTECDLGAGAALTSGTVYAVVLKVPTGTGTLYWRTASTTGKYAGGQYYYTSDGGTNWSTVATSDMMFATYDSVPDGADSISTGLQGFWPLNDNRLTTWVEDTSSNANDGTSLRTTSYLHTTGKISGAFDFDEASTDYVNFTDIAALDLGANQDVAYSFWVKRGATPTATFPVTISKYVANAGLIIYLEKASHDINAGFYYAGGANYTATATVADSTAWHHVVVNVDRSGWMSVIVDNGSLVGNVDISGQTASDLSNAASLFLGKSATYPNANFGVFDGCVDAFAAWNRILTLEEIDYLYNAGSGREESGSGSGALSDKTYAIKHVAIGNDTVYYESVAGTTMAEVTGAAGTLNTQDPIDVCTIDGKVFIVNGQVKKVLDLRNTKLSTANIVGGGVVPTRWMLLSGGTSGAQMYVDFVSASTAAAYVYGYRVTTATFVSGETVTDSGATVSFVLDANEVDPPHYYNWTPYGNDSTTYGSLPTRATIAGIYWGRIVLSGDVGDPHQWYMSYVLDPWDFYYDAATDDELRAIKGGYAQAGRIPDVVVAVIPYRDDYCVFGCATSCHYLIGNPAGAGEIFELKGTGGILSKKSWTWDNRGNLYLLTTTGLLRIPPGFGPAENLTVELWPEFVADLAYDSDTERLTMAYDQSHNGIEIAKVTIADGDGDYWWYDLSTNGLFPDDFPDDYAPFSMIFSDSLQKFIFGGFDGYLRYSDSSNANDQSTAIDSYLSLGPIPLGGGPIGEGSIGPLDVVLGGGGAAGTETDSDDVGFKVFVADTASELIEKLAANGTPSYAGTITGPGRRRGSKRTQSARGVYGGVRLANSTVDETWIFECLDIGQKPKGRSK